MVTRDGSVSAADASEGGDARFVIVSNRGPVTFSPSESGERGYSRGAGGLVTALSAVSRSKGDAVWISSAISEEDVRVAKESLHAPYEVEDFKVVLVEHEEEAYNLMYNHLANPLLWFVQHGLYDLPYAPEFDEDTKRAWEEGYVRVNRNFTEAVARILKASGQGVPAILVHDYHLYMVPLFLRERLRESEAGSKADDAFVSLFVHIPWPEPEGWRVLPRYIRKGILRGLLGADVVAFHTRRYARNFVRTAREMIEIEADEEEGVIHYEGREVWVRAYPISIDPEEFKELAQSKGVLKEEEEFVKNLPGKLLLRVDRMDLSKNVVRGFEAYGRMLERYPQMQGEVTFLAQLQPSRSDIPEYASYAEAIQKVVEEVNEKHGTRFWEPIRLSMEDNFPRSVAAYKNYDALLVNAVRDGMNLVAKEAAVVNERDGVLVLSEGAGAHEELGEHAITVNPFDVDEQAEALYQALVMSEEERARRAEGLKRAVEKNTVDEWVGAQMEDIAAFRGY
jgi:trehalose 6-phosphate synthase